MSTQKQVARSMVWTALESFGVSGLSIIGLIIIARYVSPEELGIAAMALSIVQLLNIPVEFLFVDALIRKKDAEQIDYDTAHSVSVVLGISISAACWLFSGHIAHLFNMPSLAPVLAWMGLSVAAMGFGAIIIARQRSEMEFRALAIRSFAGRFIGVIAAIAVALMGGGAWAIVAQQVLMVLCSSVVLWLQCKNRPSLRFSYTHFIDLARFGKNTVAIVGINFSIQRLFTLFVGAGLSPAAAGYINLAFRAVDILRDIVSNVVVQLSLPMFTRTSEDRDKTKSIYVKATSLTCALTYPLFAGLALCSSDFITFVFGSQWHDASPCVALLALLTLVHFTRLYSNSMLTANGYPHLPILPDLGALVFIVVITPWFGTASIMAAISVWALRLCVSLPIDVYNIRKVFGISLMHQFRGALEPFIACLTMAAVVLLLHSMLGNYSILLRLIIEAAAGALTYATVLLFIDRKRIHDIMHFGLLVLHRR